MINCHHYLDNCFVYPSSSVRDKFFGKSFTWMVNIIGRLSSDADVDARALV